MSCEALRAPGGPGAQEVQEVDELAGMECPRLDEPAALRLCARLYGLTGGTASAMVGYDDNNFWIKPEAVEGNPHLRELCPHGYTLKVTNSKDSLEVDYMEGQNLLIAYLADRGIKCPRPVRNRCGNTFSVEQLREGGPGHVVRLLEFVPGEILARVPWQADFALQAGREVAKIDSLLDNLHLPAMLSRRTEWSLSEAPRVLKFIHFVTDAAKRAIVEEVLEAFQRVLRDHSAELERDRGIIHGDFNQHNIVVGQHAIVGVLDLGDSHCAPRLFEVALTAAYMAMAGGSVEAVQAVLQGYHQHRPLTEQGVNLVRVCICARLCQSLVMGLRSHALDPKNIYVLSSQVQGWKILQELWGASTGSFEQRWMEALKLK